MGTETSPNEMLPFQTDAAITPPLNNTYGNAENYRVKFAAASGFYLTRNWQLSKLAALERPIVPDASGNVRRGSLPRQAGLSEEAGAAERSPRRLSTHQKAVLIQVLLAFPDETVSVRYSPSASDGLNYADDFSTIFRAINWTVVSAEPAEDLPYSSSGLAIVARQEKLPASAAALRDALRIYGIEAEVVKDKSNLCVSSSFALVVTKL